jgi:hypothetical protein
LCYNLFILFIYLRFTINKTDKIYKKKYKKVTIKLY